MNYIKLSDGRIIASESELKEVERIEFNKDKAIDELDKSILNAENEISSAKVKIMLFRMMMYGFSTVLGITAATAYPIAGILVLVCGIGSAELRISTEKKIINGYKSKLTKMRNIRADYANREYKEEKEEFEAIPNNRIYTYNNGLEESEYKEITLAYDIGYNSKSKTKVKRYKGKHFKQ